MSGILERIVRRRRATASSRLGPPPQSDLPSAHSMPHVNGTTPANGGTPEHVPIDANGAAAAEPPHPAMRKVLWPSPSPSLAPAPDPAAPEAGPDPAAPEAGPEPAPEKPGPLRDAAEPEAPPAPPAPEPVDPAPAFLQRGRIRRRARYLRRLREVQLRDLGGFMVELTRLQQDRPELVQGKVQRALRTDGELRGLERALGSEQPLRELREAGIGGVCARCGAVHGSGDRFCSACGEPLGRTAHPDGPAGANAG